MKRIPFLLMLLSLMAVVSCKKDAPVPPSPVPAEAPPPTPVPAPTAVPEAMPKAEDGTSISVGKDGIDVNTKSTTTKTEVSVNKDGAAVNVKK